MSVLPYLYFSKLRIREGLKIRLWNDKRSPNMPDFYRCISQLNPNNQNIAMTVIDGAYFGEKTLFSNNRKIWSQNDTGFFSRCQPELDKIQGSGIYTIEETQIFCDILANEKTLVVCGAGHVSIPIIRIGLMIGCRVIVLEDRPLFADNARKAGASQVICQPFDQGLEQIPGDRDTFFIIVTRGHRYDQICLEAIARKQHAYIGMIGSRRRTGKVKEAVIRQGGNPEVVNHIHTPIGLDIGAETPEEIAVAVMAEIIQVKNQDKRNGGYSREIMEAILNLFSAQTCGILATIIRRKGSAPRAVSTKMLVLTDGSCIGTIGGGCVEAELVSRARFILREGRKDSCLCHVDMTGDDAEDQGMVCGGIIDVLMEYIGP